MSTIHGLREYYWLEARHAPRRAALAMTVGGAITVLATHALIVRLPAGVIQFMKQAFRVRDLTAVLLVNDLMLVYFVTYFVALAALMDATVTAREENRLEILLAKPIRPRTFVAARASPPLLGGAAAGVGVSLVIAMAIRPHLTGEDTISPSGALGGGLFLSACALAALATLTPLLVRMRDSFHALMMAALVWILPLLPTAVFIYRPDYFDARPGLASWSVLSSLVWHDSLAAWVGPLAMAMTIPFAVLMVAVAGTVLERSDAR